MKEFFSLEILTIKVKPTIKNYYYDPKKIVKEFCSFKTINKIKMLNLQNLKIYKHKIIMYLVLFFYRRF